MFKIFKLALLALLAYFAYNNYASWVDSVSGIGQDLSRTGESVSQGLCVPAAEKASEAFGRGMRNYASPPIDIDAWDEFLDGVKGQIYRAETHCDCPRDSCQKAGEAINELNILIEEFDGSLRGDNVAPLNAARRQETIDKILKRARELDRQGN